MSSWRWPGPRSRKSFAATGRFVWHDEPIDAAITLTDFAAALAGDRSGLKLRLAGAPFKLAFDGNWSTRPTLKIEGTLAADAPSLRDTLRWAGLKPLPGGGFGRFALKAKTNVSGGTIALSTVNVELDGNVAEGVLAFATDGRADPARHARRRRARSDALCLDHPPAHQQRARLEPGAARRSTA